MKPFGLSADERIKSRKDFENIFSSGKIIFSSDKKIKATYFFEKNNENPGVKFAAAISKKSGKAVWRNRVKRLFKEAFRLNKKIIHDICFRKKFLLKIVFSSNSLNERKNKKIKLSDIMPGMLDVLLKLKSSL